MAALEFSPIKIFLSCSQDDEDLLLKVNLTKHLLFLKNKGFITIWSHSEIKAGEENEQVSNKNLGEADIILLLMSPDFMASDFCNTQMKEALKRHKKDNTCVIPILLRPVYWQDEPFIYLEILPKNTKPIKSWLNADEAFLDVAQNIKEAVYNLFKNQYMKTGKKLFEDNHLENALAIFEQAIQFDAQFEEVYLWKGKALSQLGQHAKALVAYDQAIHLNPKNASYFADKGNILFKLGQHTNALAHYNQAIELNPENADFYLEKSNVYEYLCQYEEAVAVLDQATQFSKRDANVYFLKATYYFELKRYEDALRSCRIAVELEPNKASYFALIAKLYEKLDLNEKALVVIKKAMVLDPKIAEYYANASNFHWYLDQYDKALLALDIAIKLNPQNPKYYALKAKHLLYISGKEEIFSRSFFRFDPDNNSNNEAVYKEMMLNGPPTNRFYMPILLSSLILLERALEAINQGLKLDSQNFEYHLLKGQTFFLLNRYDEAMAVYDQLLSLNPSNQQRKSVYQHKLEIYNIHIDKIRTEANFYGISL